jgi:hypothetical protein
LTGQYSAGGLNKTSILPHVYAVYKKMYNSVFVHIGRKFVMFYCRSSQKFSCTSVVSCSTSISVGFYLCSEHTQNEVLLTNSHCIAALTLSAEAIFENFISLPKVTHGLNFKVITVLSLEKTATKLCQPIVALFPSEAACCKVLQMSASTVDFKKYSEEHKMTKNAKESFLVNFM